MISTTITITDLDNSLNSFSGFSQELWFRPGPVNGTIEEDCTGLISVNTLGNNTYFIFDSVNLQLDLDGFGVFSGDVFPWIP